MVNFLVFTQRLVDLLFDRAYLPENGPLAVIYEVLFRENGPLLTGYLLVVVLLFLHFAVTEAIVFQSKA